MQYADGNIPQPGDLVSIDTKYRGVVVEVLKPVSQADYVDPGNTYYPTTGLFIRTDFGGLVHYPTLESIASERMTLIARAGAYQSDF
mgnify:CR=1 FL=1